MSVPKSFIEELKARLPVSQVVGKRVALKRTGREYLGLSPFSKEKTPSFTVNDEKGFYHCFSSGKHGDIFSFLMETENLSFAEAIEHLASEAGMTVPRADPAESAREAHLSSLREACAIAARFFQNELDAPRGQEARDYLDRRGLKAGIIEAFGLGYAPDSFGALGDHLLSKGIAASLLLEAGLVARREADGKIFDRFRHRVIFPIADARGRVIAFGGRALKNDDKAKYLNSPDTPLFHKGQVLFNEARARAVTHNSGGELVVVEGYMDVIALSQAGVARSVAPLGTALTAEQIERLWRLSPEPILCFDGDRAGVAAALRVVERALPLLKPAHSLKFALLPEGRDPDDVVRLGGRAAMESVLAQAIPLVDMLWSREHDAMRDNTPEQRAAFELRLEQAVRNIGDAKVRIHYAAEMKHRLKQLFAPLSPASAVTVGAAGRHMAGDAWRMATGVRTNARGPSVDVKRSALARGRTDPERDREGALILLVCAQPELVELQSEVLARLVFRDPLLDKLRNQIIDVAASSGGLDKSQGNQHVSSHVLGSIAARVPEKIKASSQAWLARAQGPASAILCWQALVAWHELSALEGELAQAEAVFAGEMTDEGFARFQMIRAQVEATRQNAERLQATLDAAATAHSDLVPAGQHAAETDQRMEQSRTEQSRD
jgi:DNA primase